MRRTLVAMLLAGLALGGSVTGSASTTLPDPLDLLKLPGQLVNDLKPPKRLLIGGWYRRIGTTNRFVTLCEASALGGYTIYTRITGCTVSSSNGGVATGVTPVIYPSLEAISPGQGGFNTGTYTACVTADALYADGTHLYASGCSPAKLLEQGWI